MLGVTTHILKKWETAFSPFLMVLRDEENARIYTEESMDILRLIKEMKDKGLEDVTIHQELAQLKAESEKEEPVMDQEEIPEVYNVSATLEKIEKYLLDKERERDEWAQLESRFKHLEKSLVEQFHEFMNGRAETASSVEENNLKPEIAEVEDEVEAVHEEKEEEECPKEREEMQKFIQKREERFVAFVQQHQRRKENKAKQRKTRRSIFKNFMETAK